MACLQPGCMSGGVACVQLDLHKWVLALAAPLARAAGAPTAYTNEAVCTCLLHKTIPSSLSQALGSQPRKVGNAAIIGHEIKNIKTKGHPHVCRSSLPPENKPNSQ